MSGLLFVVTAPSGAGKTTLIAKLLREEPQLRLSVSYTTRAPRPGEVDGREYHFVDKATFMAMLEHGDFLESAEVHGNHYGTSHSFIAASVSGGAEIVLEIDWQGAEQVRRLYPECVTIFILPPSIAELERRMRARAQDSDEVIRRRVAGAYEEMCHACEFDYAIINSDFELACANLRAVIMAERQRTTRQLARHPQLFPKDT